MKIVTFCSSSYDKTFRIGALINHDEIVDLTSIVSNSDLTAAQILDCFDLENDFFVRANDAILAAGLPKITRQNVVICAPVPRPGKIICIGLNYRNHAEESGMAIPTSPIIFSKYSSCAIGSGEPIVIPADSTQTDYEAELAVVIGRYARNVSRKNALSSVFGYTNLNDVSARDFQFADGQWQRGKSCDTFAPMGEYISTADEIADPQNLSIKFRLNGETLQDSTTSQMIFGVAELIEFLSRYVTLEPGDVIATIFHSMGLKLDSHLPGPAGRPFPLVDFGYREIHELF